MPLNQLPSSPEQSAPMQPAPAAATQQMQGLPPTGLQQQLNSLNSYYNSVQGARMPGAGGGGGTQVGFDPRQFQFMQAEQQGQGTELPEQQEIGGTSLDAMARNLAQRYGMPIGRGRLVDDYGNFLMTPQQIADASGGSVTLGEAAAQMNYISQALTRRQNEEQQQKGMAALQAGLGQVQSRGRGSLAGMMSGYYEGMADLYANQEYEAADFSFYIQKEQLDIERELQRRAEKAAKKAGTQNFVVGAALTVASLYTGNIAGVTAGAGMMYSGGSSAGWF